MINILYDIFPTVPAGFERNTETGKLKLSFAKDILANTALDFAMNKFFSKTKRPDLQINIPNICLAGASNALKITSSKISIELLNTIYKMYDRDFYKDLKSQNNACLSYAVSYSFGAAIFTCGMYPINIIKHKKYPETEKSPTNYQSFSKAFAVNTLYGASFGAVLGYFSPSLAKEASLLNKGIADSVKFLLKSSAIFSSSLLSASAITAPLRCVLYKKDILKSFQETIGSPVISSF